MLRVGLTGGIGAGKSTVARRLAERGAVVVDADALAREVVEPGSPGLAAVVEAFGPGVLTAEGALDRPALGAIVFGDESSRRRLNGILHPRIAALTAERFAALPPDAVVVHDVPLLVENGLGANYHLVIVVGAPAEERVRRLVADRGMTDEDARSRIAAQADDAARHAAADVWIDNAGDRQDVLDAVDRVWVQRLAPFERHLRTGTVPARPCGDAVVPADPTWPAQAARLVARVRRVLGEDAVRVGHEGPTSEPGRAARDVLEFGLLLAPGCSTEALPARLADAGFVPAPGSGTGGAEYLSADPQRPADLHVRRAE